MAGIYRDSGQGTSTADRVSIGMRAMDRSKTHKKSRKTAFLLVDFINLFDFDDAEKLAPRALRAARHTAQLKARARAAGVPCIYANDNFGEWTSEFSALTRTCLEKPGPASAVTRLLQPQDGDLSVLKPMHSAFYGTPLEFLLDELGIARLVITGVTADICVIATSEDAYMRKYDIWVPSNCVAAVKPSYERTALEHIQRVHKADIRPASPSSRFSR
jgi:nicotinamidase-related amidase